MLQSNPETWPWIRQRYGAARLWRDTADTREAIGALTSFFTTIDGTSSMLRSNRRRFSIGEAWQLLNEPGRQGDPDVKRRVDKVLKYETLYAALSSRPIITVAEFTDDAVVIDGNHTAMAAYLYSAKHPSTPKPLPLFVLSVPESVKALGA